MLTSRVGNVGVPSATARGQRRLTISAQAVLVTLGVLGVAAWVGAAKLAELLLPFGTDQGLFSLIGRAILDGQLPYRDVWDNKPPGLYYLQVSAKLANGSPAGAEDLLIDTSGR